MILNVLFKGGAREGMTIDKLQNYPKSIYIGSILNWFLGITKAREMQGEKWEMILWSNGT